MKRQAVWWKVHSRVTSLFIWHTSSLTQGIIGVGIINKYLYIKTQYVQKKLEISAVGQLLGSSSSL